MGKAGHDEVFLDQMHVVDNDWDEMDYDHVKITAWMSFNDRQAEQKFLQETTDNNRIRSVQTLGILAMLVVISAIFEVFQV